MKKIMLNVLRIITYILFFIVIGILFVTNHAIWATLLIGFSMLSVYLVVEKHIQDRVINELNWINSCVMNSYEVDNARAQKDFYLFVLQAFKSGALKNGMMNTEIHDCIVSNDEDDRFSFRPALYFGEQKGALKKNTVKLYGFGVAIPTPKLILKFKEGKLIKWKEKQG
ncbi:MAG: hypothetical protein GY853_04655 [PVC group bacterium]|nr:hypothetical protein [PVC group bacterium]